MEIQCPFNNLITNHTENKFSTFIFDQILKNCKNDQIVLVSFIKYK